MAIKKADPKDRRHRRPGPQMSVIVLGADGQSRLPVSQVKPETVGWKGFGLAALPDKWSSPFIVLNAEIVRQGLSANEIKQCALLAGIETEGPLLVRSSGTEETLEERGNLESGQCTLGQITETILHLQRQTENQQQGRIHWLVQHFHKPRAKGHFSNERRISCDKRDWVLEVEPRNGRPASSSPVAVRQWRDGITRSTYELECNSETGISVCLKRVAMWAQQFECRLHFEWVWDGTRVLLVQLDEEDSTTGVAPSALLPQIVQTADPGPLSVFRVATDGDFAAFRKLKNASLYQQLGYTMPPFYIFRDLNSLREILDNGSLTDALKGDLQILTQRPLIIRTDGVDVPTDKREMLPRSDELRSIEDASSWLTGTFRKKVDQGGLAPFSLALIAHHFIPSLASAWARGEPGRPFVRIEALWGIPEGLYWFSHDTFEVDTQSPELPPTENYPGTVLHARSRRRHKGTFVAADMAGRWVTHKTAPPHDWRPTISNERWLSEIAWTTKRIAQAESKPVSVMWFVGNHKSASPHRILPWFHSESALDTPKAAPRRKRRSSADFRIATAADWQTLLSMNTDQRAIERVIVEPSDPELIRNRQFAEDLAELARKRDFSIELSGGVLSHAYYVFRRHNARVECVDLFGGEEEVTEFYKVVRDRVPEVISRRGEHARTVKLCGDALIAALKQKLVEEAFEALDAPTGEELVGELADIAEVLQGLSLALGLETGRIEADRKDKHKRRGGFEQGYMLTVTGTPDSLRQEPAEPEVADDGIVISDPTRIPGRPTYRRPDLRQPGELEIEKILTTENDLNRLTGELRETLNFELPDIVRHEAQRFTLILEIRRQASVLRTTVRVRRAPSQLPLRLADLQMSLFSGDSSSEESR